MRKIILLVSITLFFTVISPIDVTASSSKIDVSTQTFIDIVLESESVAFKDYFTVEESESRTVVSMADPEGNQYLLVLERNKVYVTDEDGEVLGQILFVDSFLEKEKIQDGSNSNNRSVDNFGLYFYDGFRTSYITWEEQLVATTAISVISILISSAVFTWLGVGIAGIYQIAANIYNDSHQLLRISRSVATWAGCPILIKERLQFHNNNMLVYHGVKYQVRWLGDKWNYSNPAACRTAPY
ncbi:MAG TPA: hypothetical protein DEA45_03345 [Acholeplasmataceae bacterium]|nr:hypothetical protein [Acholeplasmataceae bacterium]